MQSRWAALLDPFLTNSTNCGRVIYNVQLQPGNNVIYHQLGRKLQGWTLVDRTTADVVYRTQPTDDEKIVLYSPSAQVIALWVF